MLLTRMSRPDVLPKEPHCRETDMYDERPTKRARTMSQEVARWHSDSDTIASTAEYLCRVYSTESNNNSRVQATPTLRPMKALPFRGAPISNLSTFSPKFPPPPDFSGNFDLFMKSSNLIPNNISTAIFNVVDKATAYRSLYRILSDNQSDARCFLPDKSERQYRCGTIWSSIVRDLLNDEALDIGLYDLREVDGSSSLQRKASDVDTNQPSSRLVRVGSGAAAGARVHESGENIIDSFGEFIIHRTWCDFSEEDTLIEVFDGHFILQIFFGDTYVKQGLADVAVHRLDFWGVRSRKRLDGNTGG